MSTARPLRHLIVVFGDQLDLDSAAFQGFDPALDAIWMAEVEAEGSHVWSHKQRIAVFLAAMRHFREALRARGWQVLYRELDEPGNSGRLSSELLAAISRHKPARVICVEPGEHRVQAGLEKVCKEAGVPLEIRVDTHFMSTVENFRRHAAGRKELRMEYFYREMRRKHAVLMNDGQPEGGLWNFDKENRKAFSSRPLFPAPLRFKPDALTEAVVALVERHFSKHPGSLESFGWPVNRTQALAALEDFVEHRLGTFGDFQDAMWTAEPFLSHSLLSVALNLKLLSPAEVVRAAETAWRKGRAPLPAVEGFIRQILGWREYVRGVYWLHMPGYVKRNALEAREPLPAFYWTGETPLRCLQDAVGQTLRHGYAHHIQRLMVTGLYTLLLGVDPVAVHEWYLAVYVDAVEWVELPNTLGMSQYADGGVMASKPYIASGKYIQRMSNYCKDCPRNPALATGPKACPFTTLYWDFLMRHETLLRGNHRLQMQVRNLDRMDAATKAEIQAQAAEIRKSPACAA